MDDRLITRLIVPLYERVTGRRPWSEATQLGELQWRAPAELEMRAMSRLQPLLAHAGVHVPYYRDLFRAANIAPNNIRTLADLEQVPTTTKASLRAASPRVLADNLPARRRVRRVTGGSTGAPFTFFVDRGLPDFRLGTFLLFRKWAGVGDRDARLHIASAIHFQDRPGRLERVLRRQVLGERLVFALG